MPNSLYHITEEQWNRIKCLFPKEKKVGRPPLNSRTVFNAVLWILKSGARWRDLPTYFGNGATAACSNCYYNCSTPTPLRLLCSKLIRPSAKFIRVHVRV